MGASYRIAQFWWAITAEDLPKTAQSVIRSLLSQEEWDLFQLFSPSDRRHGYQVYQTLIAAGVDQHDLLVAGILHDIGKTRVQLSVLERVEVVLAEHWFSNQMVDWGKGSAQGWKRPFVVKLQHPEWGAELVEEAGSSTMVVNLIRRHQDPLPQPLNGVEDELLSLLQWADDQN